VSPVSDSSRPQPFWATSPFGAIALIALVWAAVTAWAAAERSSTFDEPLHAAASMAAVRGHLEINPEHPPLWKYVAGLANLGPARQLDLSSEAMGRIERDPIAQWPWAVGELYQSGRMDGEAVVRRSGLAMLLFGVGLIGLGGYVGLRLGGGRAGVMVAGLLALDPLMLGHGAVVSNDVAVAGLVLASVWTAVRLRGESGKSGESGWSRAAGWRACGLGVLLGAAVCTKFTGIVVFPLAAGLLLLRRRPRWGALGLALLVSYATIWAAYEFRYAPAPDGTLIHTTATVQRIGEMRQVASGGTAATGATDQALAPDAPTRFLVWVESTHLLPQGLTAGLLMSYAVTRSNPAFAAGQFSLTGFWWYFPFAAVVKTPIGLLAVWGIGLCHGRLARAPAAIAASDAPHTGESHVTRPLVIAALFLMLASMASPLNIGVRHLLPTTVLLTVLGGVALAKVRRWVAVVICVGLLVEVAAAFPNYISFFNLPARLIGPEKLLADSNLDWGQDLAGLARWRQAHPKGTLYVAYWGTADPSAYDLTVVNLPNTYPYGQVTHAPDVSGYVAVSVTYLQPLPHIAPFYARLLERPPEAKIGDSIRIWKIP
jgi:hypothetical protein